MSQLLVIHVQPAFDDSSKFIHSKLKNLKGITKAQWLFCDEDQSGDDDFSIYEYLQYSLNFRESTASRILNESSYTDSYGFIREAIDTADFEEAFVLLDFMHKNKLYNIKDKDSENLFKFLKDVKFMSSSQDFEVSSLKDFNRYGILYSDPAFSHWPVDLANWLETTFDKGKKLKLAGGLRDRCLKEVELLALVLGFKVQLTDAIY